MIRYPLFVALTGFAFREFNIWRKKLNSLTTPLCIIFVFRLDVLHTEGFEPLQGESLLDREVNRIKYHSLEPLPCCLYCHRELSCSFGQEMILSGSNYFTVDK